LIPSILHKKSPIQIKVAIIEEKASKIEYPMESIEFFEDIGLLTTLAVPNFPMCTVQP
jgi:hypothetical protein